MNSPGANLPPFSSTERGTKRPGLHAELTASIAPTAMATPRAQVPSNGGSLGNSRQRSSSHLPSNGSRTASPSGSHPPVERDTLRSVSTPGLQQASSEAPQLHTHTTPAPSKTSFKDLVARFDQAGTGTGPASTQTMPPNRNTPPRVTPQSSIPQPLTSTRPRENRRGSDARTGVSERPDLETQLQHDATQKQRSSSFVEISQPRSRNASKGATSNGPLFGEIVVSDSNHLQPGHGITSHRRRGSESSTVHHVKPMVSPAKTSYISQDNGQVRHHHRSLSDTPESPTLPNSHSFSNSREPHIVSALARDAQRPLGQSHSHSRIPVKTSGRPTTPNSSGHSRIMSQTTPTKSQTNSPRRQGLSPAQLGSSGPRLKALISAPEPKKSPPLRSSRPRQQVNEVSLSNSLSRTLDPLVDSNTLRALDVEASAHPKEPIGAKEAQKSYSPDQRTFSERAIDNPAKLQTLNSAVYDASSSRLHVSTGDAQSKPGAHEEPRSSTTEFEDEPYDQDNMAPGANGLGVSRSVLSQVLELRRRNTQQYSMPGAFASLPPEDESGTIQIMLGGTPLLEKYEHEWAAEMGHGDADAAENSLAHNHDTQPDSDHLGPAGWTPGGIRELPRPVEVRPSSTTYSIIENILNQYMDKGSLTPDMVHDFSQQMRHIDPDLYENHHQDNDEIARATLQGLIDEVQPLRSPEPSTSSQTTLTAQPSYHRRPTESPKMGNTISSPSSSHITSWIDPPGPTPPPKSGEWTTPLNNLSLPVIHDTGGTLDGVMEPTLIRSPPRQTAPRAPPLPPPPVNLPSHDPPSQPAYKATPPTISLNSHSSITNESRLSETYLSETPPTQALSFDSASGRPSTDQDRGASSASIKSQDDSVKEEKRLNTRRMVIKELVDTEFSYSADMKILEDIYMATGKSSEAISDDDQRVLFGNMHHVVEFTMAFQDTLKRAAASIYSRPREKRFHQPQLGADGRGSTSTSNSNPDAPTFPDTVDESRDRLTTIGAAFWQHMPKFEKVYGEYMRNHSAANERYLRIKDQRAVQAWLNECKEYAKDLTDAWDLDSLLVKPTQRMMKYHMILDSLLSKTPDNHPDRDALQGAITELKAATSRINDSKKRADLLEQINNPRKRSDVTLGLSKVLGRRQDKLRQQIGLTEAPDDAEFMSVHEKYGGYYLKLQVVMRDFDSYKQKCDTFMTQFNALMDVWEETMDVHDKPVHAEIESKWRRAAMTIREMTAIAWVDHEAAVQRHCIEPLLSVIKLNEKTQKFMQKRKKRVPEYAKWKTLQSRGDKPDKKTQEAADQYMTYTDLLKEELPKLYQFTNMLIGKCLHNFVDIQKLWHVTWKRKLQTILDEQGVPSSMDHILQVLQGDWQAPYAEAQNLGICNGSVLQQAGNFISFPPEREPRLSSGQSSRRTTQGSQQAPGWSPDPGQGRFSEQSGQTPPVSLGSTPRFPYPSNVEDAFNLPNKFNSGSAGPTTANFRDARDFAQPRPARSTQPGANRISADSFAAGQAPRPTSSSTYYTTANSQQQSTGASPAKPNVFSSAMPMPDSPTDTRAASPQEEPAREEVLFVAASLFEFHINQPRSEAGFRYLTYVPGEIFDVLGEKGELWLARNQDDPAGDVGWIWEKHFAKVVDM